MRKAPTTRSPAGPYGRDVLAMLAEACAAASMPLGFYYSPPDMHHPGYRDTRRLATENWWGEADGTFPPEAIERLEKVGAWMDVYGESIWGTTHGPVQGDRLVRSTAK